jgi:hypothetical protein
MRQNHQVARRRCTDDENPRGYAVHEDADDNRREEQKCDEGQHQGPGDTLDHGARIDINIRVGRNSKAGTLLALLACRQCFD